MIFKKKILDCLDRDQRFVKGTIFSVDEDYEIPEEIEAAGMTVERISEFSDLVETNSEYLENGNFDLDETSWRLSGDAEVGTPLFTSGNYMGVIDEPQDAGQNFVEGTAIQKIFVDKGTNDYHLHYDAIIASEDSYIEVIVYNESGGTSPIFTIHETVSSTHPFFLSGTIDRIEILFHHDQPDVVSSTALKSISITSTQEECSKPNLIKNGNFLNGRNGWTLNNNFIVESDTCELTSNTTPMGGIVCSTITNTDGEKTFTTIDNEDYILSFDLFDTTALGDSTVQVTVTEVGVGIIYDNTYSGSQHVEIPLTLDASCYFVRFVFSSTDATEKVVSIDNVSILPLVCEIHVIGYFIDTTLSDTGCYELVSESKCGKFNGGAEDISPCFGSTLTLVEGCYEGGPEICFVKGIDNFFDCEISKADISINFSWDGTPFVGDVYFNLGQESLYFDVTGDSQLSIDTGLIDLSCGTTMRIEFPDANVTNLCVNDFKITGYGFRDKSPNNFNFCIESENNCNEYIKRSFECKKFGVGTGSVYKIPVNMLTEIRDVTFESTDYRNTDGTYDRTKASNVETLYSAKFQDLSMTEADAISKLLTA